MVARFYIFLGAATLACCTIARAAEPTVIHVSPRGTDSGDGSAEHPLASWRAAQRQVFETLNAGAAHVLVKVAAGEYVLDQPLVFTPSDGARSPDGSVRYAAVGGEVRVSGGRRISGWRAEGNRWITGIAVGAPAFRDLWVNGRRAIRARTPNEGYYRVEAAGPDNRTSFTVAASDLVSLAHPEMAEIGFLHDWSMSRVRLAAVDPKSRTYRMQDAIGADEPQFAISNFDPHPRYFVENASELLDAPGEWYFDPSRGKLSYLPREGETLETVEAIAPHLATLVEIRGAGVRPVVNLNFEGITFSHARFQFPPHGYAGIQAAWHERRNTPGDGAAAMMPAAVLLDHGRNCQFTGCRLEHLAACGLRLIHDEQSRLDHCEFNDVGGDGILIGSREISDTPLAHRDTVENCLVENCGVDYFGAVGVWIGFAREISVTRNEIRNLPYTGISVGWKWDDEPTPCQGHQIVQNHIHDVLQALSDGGGIYTLGRQPQTRLSGNVIHGIPQNAGRAESNGIFMDQGSTEIAVEGNTIYGVANSPIRFHMAGANSLSRNRLAALPGTPIFQFNACDAKAMTFQDNQEILDAAWQPPADDPSVKAAGPR